MGSRLLHKPITRMSVKLADLLMVRGQLHVLIGLYKEAEDDYNRAHRSAIGKGDRAAMTRAVLEIANIAYLKGQFQQCLKYLKQIQPSVNKLKDPDLTFSLWRYKGNMYRIQGDFNAALACYRRLVRQKGSRGRYSRAVALNLIGLAYHGAGNYGKAVAYIRQAYAIWKDSKNLSAQGSSLANIGYVYTFSGMPEKALPCFEKAVALLYKINATSLIAAPSLNWGSAFYKLGRYDDALKKWQEALVMNEQLGDFSVIAMLHNNIGYAFIKKKGYQESIEHLQISLAIKKRLGLTGYLPSTYNGFATAHYNLFMQTKRKEHHAKAMGYAKTAKKIARTYNNTHDAGIAQELLQKIAKRKK